MKNKSHVWTALVRAVRTAVVGLVASVRHFISLLVGS